MTVPPDALEVFRVVRCPGCGARYRLSERLLGEGGARVRCPGCRVTFRIARAEPGERAERSGEPAERSRPPAEWPREPAERFHSRDFLPPQPLEALESLSVAAAPPKSRERAIADEVLAELQAAHAKFAAASTRGALLAEHGPALLSAFDRYRERAGAGGTPRAFRDALRERLGIDLPDGEDRSAAPPEAGGSER